MLKVLISGSTGLIGSALASGLDARGHEVVRLVRPESRADGPSTAWDPEAQTIDRAGLEGFDAVVHLAGENIAAHRWTRRQKERIRRSRVDGTMLLCSTLASLDSPPRVLLSGSALGYYGDRGADVLSEDHDPGEDFLGRTTWEWERAALGSTAAGIRVVNLRFGLVLTASGGLLGQVLPLFRLGLGGRLGNGRQYMSWISRHDAVSAVEHLLECEDISGPVNVSSPEPVTNAEFTRKLARAVRRPAFCWVPRLALAISQGQVTESVLASARMDPAKLVESGFRFEHPDLESALSWALEDR